VVAGVGGPAFIQERIAMDQIALFTRFVPCTDTKGARIRVAHWDARDRKVRSGFYPYDHSEDSYGAHVQAVCRHIQTCKVRDVWWVSTFREAGRNLEGNGWVFTLDPADKPRLTPGAK